MDAMSLIIRHTYGSACASIAYDLNPGHLSLEEVGVADLSSYKSHTPILVCFTFFEVSMDVQDKVRAAR